MLFFPKGIGNREVADPSNLSREYTEAVKIANNVSHQQFRKGSFPIETFNHQHCNVTVSSKFANLKVTKGNGPILPKSFDSSSGVVSDVTSSTATIPQAGTSDQHNVGPSSNLFEISYNKGFVDIPDTSVTWTSEYPELCLIYLVYQYCRSHNEDYLSDSDSGDFFGAQSGDPKYSKMRKHRLQSAINVDGANIPGTGPNGVPTGDSFRGTAFTGRSLHTSVATVQFLPAGTHTVKGVVALGPSGNIVDNDGNVTRSTMYNRHSSIYKLSESQEGAAEDKTTATQLKGLAIGENAVIASRRLILIRFARGKLLE
tara:strand:- start:5867 stop:6808 length:942 start_codon:yes stop_codon:yes gene_type:complete